jgi:predicted metal-dependent peptidase
MNDYMMKLMESFPVKEPADYYFERLLQDPEVQKQMKNGGGTLEIILGGDAEGSIGGSLDDHTPWDDIDEDLRDMIREQLRDMVAQGIRNCEPSNSWGSVPVELQQVLRNMVAGQVDWKSLLRQFIGMSISAEKSNSIKRINRKYPYVHPGRKRKYRAKVVVYIDQSGSVGDDNIEEMFGELNCLAKHVDFTVFAFDTQVSVDQRLEWKRGQKKPTIRFRSGGTDFNAPTRHFNEHKGEWDAMIIFSDGECSKPEPALGRRAYIIVPDRKLCFEPDPQDTVIQMTADKRKKA